MQKKIRNLEYLTNMYTFNSFFKHILSKENTSNKNLIKLEFFSFPLFLLFLFSKPTELLP